MVLFAKQADSSGDYRAVEDDSQLTPGMVVATGYGSKDSRVVTERPDAWPGWKWDANAGQWSDAHDRDGHTAWLQQQKVGTMAEDTAANAPTWARVRDEFGIDPMGAGNARDPRIDLTKLDPFRADRQAALGDQRRVLEFALGLEGPQQLTPQERDALEQRFADRALRTANTAASSARGGAGAVSAARLGVNQQLPAIAGEANLAASQAASQEFQNRVAAFNARVGQAGVAGQVSNVIGNTATNAFGQELQGQQAVAQVDLAQEGINVQAQGILANVATDLLGLQYNYAKLPLETQLAILDDITKRYGIDETVKAQIKAAAAANKKGPLDYLTTIFKVGTDVASAATGMGLFTKGLDVGARALDTTNPYG